jgi:hypothetical protein
MYFRGCRPDVGIKKINQSHSSPYRDIYSKESIDKIRKLYARDIEMLGYNFD